MNKKIIGGKWFWESEETTVETPTKTTEEMQGESKPSKSIMSYFYSSPPQDNKEQTNTSQASGASGMLGGKGKTKRTKRTKKAKKVKITKKSKTSKSKK